MDFTIFQILLSTAFAFGAIYLTIPILVKVAYERDLYDKPDSERKFHDRYIPTFGGIAIYLALITAFSISGVAEEFTGYSYFVAALTLLFFSGLKDDIIGLSPLKKLIVQFVAAGLLIFGSGIYIQNFYGVLGIYELPYWVSVLITAFTMIVITNAFNLIDGIDGLAGGIGAIASFFFSIGFWVGGVPAMAVLSLILSVSLVAFLRYNFKPASIFMGDTGSLIVGFLLSVLAVKFIGLNEISSYTALFGFTSSILPVAILAVPLYDTISVFYKRIKRGDSPFQPGRDHIHHSILNMGFGHRGVSLILYMSTIFITLLAVTMSAININVLLVSILVSTTIFLPFRGYKRNLLRKFGLDIEALLQTNRVIHEFRRQMETRSANENSTSAPANAKTLPNRKPVEKV